MQQPLPPQSLTPVPDDPARTLLQAQRLLACFQHALGHELPNHLVAIQGMARLLEQDAAAVLAPDDRACLLRLAQSAQRAHVLVVALADMGRACRKRDPAVAVALEDLWHEATAATNWLCPGHSVRYDVLGPLPRVVVPPAAGRRVLVEVLQHALRRTAPGQPLRIQVTAVATEVQIRDDGPAPTSLQQQQAFDPLIAATGDPAALGLFLARQLAENWGGDLRIEAGTERGCVALIQFPGD